LKTQIEALNETSLLVRDMRSVDLEQVVLLERNAHLSPWGRLSFEESLTRGDRCRVIEANQEVIAYHVCSQVVDELHVLNVVSAPPLQGAGLGHRLIRDIVDGALESRLKKIFLEVRVSNNIAQNLYQKWQFRQIAIRKNYYRNPVSQVSGSCEKKVLREDALVYVRDVATN